MDPKKLFALLEVIGEPKFRGKQVLKAVYSGAATYQEITTIPQALKDRLSQDVPILCLQPDVVKSSQSGFAHKARLALYDGEKIEAVLMQPKPGGHWSVCVSSQVGCALACNFCATGLMGFKRNLSAEEICDQLLFWVQFLKKLNPKARISNVVFMGMGEPMLNFDAVKEAIAWMTDHSMFNIGHRSIAVSTAGVAPGMDRFADELKQVHLALSLHAANEELRSRLVPINKAYPLDNLIKTLKRYFEKNNRKVFLEYVLLEGENDQPEHALELVKFIRKVGHEHLLHVNLITWNPTDTPHRSPERSAAAEFKKLLVEKYGIFTTIRKNLGREIDGACGQLITEKSKKFPRPHTVRPA